MLKLWREAAGTVAAEQWRRFWETGRFDAVADVATDHRKASAMARSVLIRQIAGSADICMVPPREARDRLPKAAPGFIDPSSEMKASLGAAQTQMVRRQVVGMLEGFISNRMNDFVLTVFRSTLDEPTRRMLFAVNKARAWFNLKRPVMIQSKKGGPHDTLVPTHLRHLARKIMSSILGRHRKPSTRRIGMTVDRRIAKLEASQTSKRFKLWFVLTVAKGVRVKLPLSVTPPFLERVGDRSASFNIQANRETGRLTVGVTTDIGKTCEAGREAYAASADGMLRLDFGLKTLFVSDKGDLVGRGFMDKLIRLDKTLTGIARHVARSGQRLRTSARYRAQVTRIRGFITTMVNWGLGRLARLRRPATLILERLDFRSPDLSRRMNRLLSNCGRGAVKDKLKALEEELGVVSTTEPSAYTSQTCSGCGYVARNNRTTQALFECRWCGMKMHADANAARNLGQERFRPPEGLYGRAARNAVLARLVTGHDERWSMERRKHLHGRPRGRGAPPDPRRSNPYFKGWFVEARSGSAGDGEIHLKKQERARG
jgi:putative transposase